jgi:hypothetical protein
MSHEHPHRGTCGALKSHSMIINGIHGEHWTICELCWRNFLRWLEVRDLGSKRYGNGYQSGHVKEDSE